MKNRVLSILLACLLMVAMVPFMVGCGEAKTTTIEQFVADNPKVGKSLEMGIDSTAFDGVTTHVEYSKNTIIAEFKFEETFSDNMKTRLADGFESEAEELNETFKSSIDKIEKESGISGVKFKLVFVNGDGEEIWNHMYK